MKEKDQGQSNFGSKEEKLIKKSRIISIGNNQWELRKDNSLCFHEYKGIKITLATLSCWSDYAFDGDHKSSAKKRVFKLISWIFYYV